jgi:hypothetical protein
MSRYDSFNSCFVAAMGLGRNRYCRLLLGMLLLFGAISARAATTWQVTDTSDSAADTDSLRYAVNHYASGDTINITATGTITLSSTLTISNNVTINGPGAALLTVSGNHAVTVVTINSGAIVTISNLTVANGFSGTAVGAGGIYNLTSVLTVNDCAFSGNTGSTNSSGGGITNFGTLVVNGSTFSGNTGQGGGIENTGPLTVINSTFSGNTSNNFGGGAIISNSSAMTVINSTFAGNNVGFGYGGGIYNLNTAGKVTVDNNVFSGNIAYIGGGGFYGNGFTGSNNVFYGNQSRGEDDTTGYGTSAYVYTTVAPLLPLNNYGGSILSMLPAPGSAAICAGSYALAMDGSTQLTTDQRGFPLLSSCVDAGAVQSNYLLVTNNSDSGAGSLRAAITASGSAGMADIELSPTLFNATSTESATTISLASALSAMTGQVNIIGPGMTAGGSSASATISCGVSPAFGPIFAVSTGAEVFLGGLTITGGNSTEISNNGGDGGAVVNVGTLTVDNSTFFRNTATYGGAIFNNDNAMLIVNNSTFSDNMAVGPAGLDSGGGIFNSGVGTVAVNNSTFSGNIASNDGGGIWNNSSGAVTISNSTFTSNTASSGGGIGGGYLTVNNSVFSGNSVSSASQAVGGGIYIVPGLPLTGSNNLFYGNTAATGYEQPVEDDTTGYGTSKYVYSTVAPLSGLGSYGGPTQSMMPLPGGGAICAGSAANIPFGMTTDQRGFPNSNTTYTYYSSTTPCVDAGAVQSDYTAIQFTASSYSGTVDNWISPPPIVTVKENGQTLGIPLTLSFSGSSPVVATGLNLPAVIASGTNAGALFTDLEVNTAGNYTLSTAATTSAANVYLTASGVTPAAELAASTASLDITGGVHFSISAPAATSGTAFSFTVAALDANNNPVTAYNGTIHFSSSDGAAVLPANATLVSGTGTFTAKLFTVGTQTITATDTANPSITGSGTVIVSGPGMATHFSVSVPATALIGTSFSFTVTALDAGNNVASGYSGTVHFSSSDGAAVLPANAVFTSGSATFTATPGTLGSQTITVTDIVTAITGTSSQFNVLPALPTVTQVAPSSGIVTGGTAVTLTGTNFSNVQGVKFGSVAATGYTVTSATQIAATSPPGTGTGTVNVTVTTASGTSANTTASQFTYVAPAITVLPASLSNGTYGAAYSQMISATGGTTPYSYSITAGVLPPGLGLTTGGLLSGTPTAVGSYNFTITATDSNKYTGSQAYTLAIGKATLTLTANNAARVFGTANPGFTGTIAGAVNGNTFTESFSTVATSASIVGGYPIVPSVVGANLADYTVVATNGVLTISQAGTATTFALSNNNLTMTATVVSLTSGVPTGTVSFYEGQTLVGTGTLSGGTASYTATSFPIGGILVSAEYSGDANFTESASPPILVLSLLPTLTSLTATQAGSVTDKINLSVASGFAGTVQFSCTGLPQNALCSFQPSSFTFTGTASTASAVMTIQTGVSMQGSVVPLHSNASPRNPYTLAALWMPGLFALLAARCGRRRKPPFYKLMMIGALFSIGASLVACGGSPSTSGSGSSVRTPIGTSTVQVIATGPNGLSQTTGLTLTVQ